MDIGTPVRSVIPSLDGQVLMTLAGTTRPMSGRQVASLAGASQRGVALVLARLVYQGLVLAEQHGRSTLYEGNRDHVAWPVVEALAALRNAVVDVVRQCLSSWQPRPVTALIFGSFARGEGNEDSDIDILLVRPTGTVEDEPTWDQQKGALRRLVQRSTGNACQLVDLDDARLARHVELRDPMVDSWKRDGIHVGGLSFDAVVRQALNQFGGAR